MLDPITKIKNILHLITDGKFELGDCDIGGVAFAKRIHTSQIYFAIARRAALCSFARDEFPETTQVIKVMLKYTDQNCIQIRKRMFALNFHHAPDFWVVFQRSLKTVNLFKAALKHHPKIW